MSNRSKQQNLKGAAMGKFPWPLAFVNDLGARQSAFVAGTLPAHGRIFL
jgi:hypothetical protein